MVSTPHHGGGGFVEGSPSPLPSFAASHLLSPNTQPVIMIPAPPANMRSDVLFDSSPLRCGPQRKHKPELLAGEGEGGGGGGSADAVAQGLEDRLAGWCL